MARQVIDKELRKNIVKARKLINFIDEKDANEAETRTCIYNIFETLGYTRFVHITQEYATTESGDSERCDLAIRLDEKSSPEFLVEIKRVNAILSKRYLRQVEHYAIDKGCEWALLTNGKDWQIYHISFDQPPQTTLIDSWNILDDELGDLADKFGLICYKSIKKGSLNQIWINTNALTPRNILRTILSKDSITLIKRNIRRTTGVAVSAERVVEAIKRLLNQAALSEMENIKISLADKKPKKKNVLIVNEVKEENKQEPTNINIQQ